MSTEQKNELKNDIMVINEGEEDPIEEEIEGGSPSPNIQKQKSKATTKESSSEEGPRVRNSRNQGQQNVQTFAEQDEHIEFSESFKKREVDEKKQQLKLKAVAIAASNDDSCDVSKSNSQTFGKRSRAATAAEAENGESYEEDYEEEDQESEDITRERSQPSSAQSNKNAKVKQLPPMPQVAQP